MKALNEIDEPLNPYSRLFMLLWAVAMIIVAGFRADNQDKLITRYKVPAIPTTIKPQASLNPAQNTLALAGSMSEKSPNSVTINHGIR